MRFATRAFMLTLLTLACTVPAFARMKPKSIHAPLFPFECSPAGDEMSTTEASAADRAIKLSGAPAGCRCEHRVVYCSPYYWCYNDRQCWTVTECPQNEPCTSTTTCENVPVCEVFWECWSECLNMVCEI